MGFGGSDGAFKGVDSIWGWVPSVEFLAEGLGLGLCTSRVFFSLPILLRMFVFVVAPVAVILIDVLFCAGG